MTGSVFRTCVVVGATGGIGRAVVQALLARDDVEHVICLSRSGQVVNDDPRCLSHPLDFEDEASIANAADLAKQTGPLDLVFVATGLLHDSASGYGPEKSLRNLSGDTLARAFHVNTIGPALVARYFLPLMRRDEKSVFAAISARVGSISDNRIGGWYGYRAAKAALNQIIRTAAIEHKRRFEQGVVVALHPGTVDTNLSEPFQRNVPEGKLFTPAFSADRMLSVLDNLSSEDTGKLIAYDGSEIPF